MATTGEILVSTVQRLLKEAGLPTELVGHLKSSSNRVIGSGPVIPSSFAIGAMAQATVAASALAAVHFLRARGGPAQDVSVDERHAVLEFLSQAWFLVDGKPPSGAWDSIAGAYQTKDEGYVRIHTNFPHHRQGILDLLYHISHAAPSSTTRQSVQSSILSTNLSSFEFEQIATNRGLCVAALRSFEEWDETPQGRALKGVPAVNVIRIGDGLRERQNSKRDKSVPKRPLEGIRVLELTRVLAGPVAGRTLAAHGADVLWITSPNLPDLPIVDRDTSRGKRTTQLDLTQPQDREKLEELIKETDVFLQSYRPEALEAKGFGPQRLMEIKPGIIIANLRAYGWDGPWRDRRGFDSLVQTATGFNVAEAESYNQSPSVEEGDSPLRLRPFPVQCLDHAAGQLLTLGIISALDKTWKEGGSYEVRVSLAGTGNLLRSLPRLPPEIGFGPYAQPISEATSQEIQDLSYTVASTLESGDTAAGTAETPGSPGSKGRKMTALRHAAVLSETPVRLGISPGGLDVHQPVWLPRGKSDD
ncbi:CoA-transferase family III domain-containing protein [Cantharellus anzutake]|uniref:CoA-transferase family III domain-containing protein n=1 Tax=Cantharellus anzutake TaxID=1750568 RepID=UPI001906B186|nr:CoA-transferase family III domain-containing protein [Cantharellus anzutake]KAF8340595.1 CoA-transferase family III domain-containing protein [Cantharellus anzutake]